MIPEYYNGKMIENMHELSKMMHNEKVFIKTTESGENEFNTRRFEEFVNIVIETALAFFDKPEDEVFLKLDCLYCRLLEAKYAELTGESGTKYSDLERDPKCLAAKVFTETLEKDESELRDEIKEHDIWLAEHPNAYLQDEEKTWEVNQNFYHVKQKLPCNPIDENDKVVLMRFYPSCLGLLVNKDFSGINKLGKMVIESTLESPVEALKTMNFFFPVLLNFDNPDMKLWVKCAEADYFNEVDIINLLKGNKLCTPLRDGFDQNETTIKTISKYLSCPVECVFMLMHYYGLGRYIQIFQKGRICISIHGFKKLAWINDLIKLRLVGYINRTNSSTVFGDRDYRLRSDIPCVYKPQTEEEDELKKLINTFGLEYSYFELKEVKESFMDSPEKFNRALDILIQDDKYGGNG